MLGAIVGDIVGSIREGGDPCSKDFPLFGPGADFTDDTVCTVALADAVLRQDDPASTLRRWCRRYPGRGYGGMFRRWIDDERLGPYGSFGNGAAMRISPVALLADDLDGALALADRLTAITHDHPEALRGARATVTAIRLARAGQTAAQIRAAIAERFGYDLSRSVDGIRPTHRFDVTCQGTVPVALVCALEGYGFEDALRNAVSLGGDTDTLACIAGGVAEARFGIPHAIAAEARVRLPPEMVAVVEEVYRRASLPPPWAG